MMIKIYLMMMTTITIFMMNLFNPLSMGFMLLIQTILVSLISRYLICSSWLSMTMFMIMVSGLMIIFIYVASICSNNKFSFFNKKYYMNMFMTSFVIFNSMETFNFSDNYQLKDNFNNEFFKLYLPMNIPYSMFMFIYLLIMLIIMINLLNMNKGPLRKKY